MPYSISTDRRNTVVQLPALTAAFCSSWSKYYIRSPLSNLDLRELRAVVFCFMLILVSQLDIDTGTPDDNEDCAIARAIKRALPSGTFVRVELNGEPADIDVITPPGNAFVQIRQSYAFVATWHLIKLPVEVAVFIRAYDEVGPETCAPMSFELAFAL